jgi:hypothetical protein
MCIFVFMMFIHMIPQYLIEPRHIKLCVNDFSHFFSRKFLQLIWQLVAFCERKIYFFHILNFRSISCFIVHQENIFPKCSIISLFSEITFFRHSSERTS